METASVTHQIIIHRATAITLSIAGFMSSIGAASNRMHNNGPMIKPTFRESVNSFIALKIGKKENYLPFKYKASLIFQ